MSRDRTRTLFVAVSALALVLALAACGGSDDGSDDAATTGAAETTAAATNVRLDPASWNRYQETRKNARAVNEKAIKTFQSCRQLVLSSVPAEKVQACLGDSVDSVVAEGKHVMGVLDDLKVAGGACADASDDLHGNVKLYTATVNGIGQSVEQGSVPTTDEIESAMGLLTASRAAAAEYERACKPQ
jgi:hypothetical protein